MVVGVSAEGLDERWLGRILDRSSVEDLIALGKKFGFDPAFEGGEGETFVLDCSLFSKEIVVLDSSTHGKHGYYYLNIQEALLSEKPLAKINLTHLHLLER